MDRALLRWRGARAVRGGRGKQRKCLAPSLTLHILNATHPRVRRVLPCTSSRFSIMVAIMQHLLLLLACTASRRCALANLSPIPIVVAPGRMRFPANPNQPFHASGRMRFPPAISAAANSMVVPHDCGRSKQLYVRRWACGSRSRAIGVPSLSLALPHTLLPGPVAQMIWPEKWRSLLWPRPRSCDPAHSMPQGGAGPTRKVGESIGATEVDASETATAAGGLAGGGSAGSGVASSLASADFQKGVAGVLEAFDAPRSAWLLGRATEFCP